MSKDLARRKEDKVSGGHVNYYLVIITLADGSEIVAEVEDIIEALNMNFAAGTVFKALVRLCKVRMDLGKPGSTKLYEADKSVYYSDRSVVNTMRRRKAMGYIKKLLVSVEQYRLRKFLKDPAAAVITISDPKRLSPYTFVMKDFIQALEPTDGEAEILKSIMTVSYLRTHALVPLPEEEDWVQRAKYSAGAVKLREHIAEQTLQSRNKANG